MTSSPTQEAMGTASSQVHMDHQENPDGIDHSSLDMAMLGNMMAAKPVSVRIPRFMPFAVDLWRQQVEACFAIHNVHAEKYRYYQVLASLEPEILQKVTAYISSPSIHQEYTGLIEALLFAFDRSDGEKIDELFDASLGDSKPVNFIIDSEGCGLIEIRTILRYSDTFS